jgi:Ribonuclease G/E
MSARLEPWRDAAIGETREALVRDGDVVALRVERWSDEGRRARWGELYAARVRTIDRRRRGAYLDLGLSEDEGFLPLNGAGEAQMRGERVALREGEAVTVRIAREAARGKNPVLELLKHGNDAAKPGRIAQPECDEELASAKAAEPAVRQNLDEAIDAALARTAPLAGGGALIIEPTAALVAIDVDAGARAGSGDAEQFALDLNLAAAHEAARQLRLRNLGGIVAIDFVTMRGRAHQQALEDALRAAFKDDPWTVQFGRLSRFGVFELSRAQLRAPLHETLCGREGALRAETLALMALRAIEREARAHGGRRIACTISVEAKAWLDGDAIAWREALSASIGPRWSIEAGGADWPREKIDARAP